MTHDAECRRLVRISVSLAVPWLLSSSYAYYVLDQIILSDACYDWLAATAQARRSEISHFHAHIIPDDFWERGASTLFDIKEDAYPERVKSATRRRLTGLRSRGAASEIAA